MRQAPFETSETTPKAEIRRVSLAAAPCGSRARLLDAGADVAQSAALAAMGVTPDEVLVVHRSGEPTIVSLGTWRGRRIGLSARAARELIVAIED